MIEFQNVSKTYPNGVEALKNITLEIEPGQFVAIIGLSGAGKSTLIKLVNKMIDVTEGNIKVNDLNIPDLKGKELRQYRRKVGMVFQSFNLINRTSVINNVLAARVPDMNPFLSLFGIFTKNDKMIAFAIVMPSFSKALQEINGHLFPFGFMKLLKAKKESKEVTFYLIGIDSFYQNKGITAVIFDEYYKTFTEKGIENCIRTPELADNMAIQQIWKHFNPKVTKRRKTFRKQIS